MAASPSPPGRTVLLNGVQLYFDIHGAGDPLILLHGFTGCSQDWSPLIPAWAAHFHLIVPDLRGHGRSGTLTAPFRHRDAAADIFAILDYLGVATFKGLGISGGGNILLHLAAQQPERVSAMVLVSATSYFPEQARTIMRQYATNLGESDWTTLRSRHPGGDDQINALLASTAAFADSYDDMNFAESDLAAIKARTLIVQGDRDFLYPVEISVDMARAIPNSSLWIIPNGGHGPIGGARWPEFTARALDFLRK